MKLKASLTTIVLLASTTSSHASFIVSPSSHQKTTFFKSTSTTTTSSSLYARPNRNVPTSDPYASLINKVDPSASTTTPDIIPPAADVDTTASSKAVVVEQVNNLVDQVNQAANTAIEASNKVTEITGASVTSSIASDVLPAAVDTTTTTTSSAQSIAETTTTSSTATTVTEAVSSTASAAAATSEESYEKVPTLFEFIKKGGVSPTSTVPPTTKEKLLLLKSNLISPVENTVNTVVAPTATKAFSETSKSLSESTNIAKGVLGSTTQGLNEVTQSAKSLVSGVTATGAAAVGTVSASDGTTAASSLSSFDAEGLNQLMENLQLNTYGPWIIGGASIFYAFNAKEAGRKEAMEQYESELKLAQQKAVEAANAAEVAAKGAQMAKELVESNMDVVLDKKGNVGDQMLENSRIELVQVENNLMKEKIERLTSENMEQRIIIAQLNEKLNPTKIVQEIEKTKADVVIVKESMNRDPAEDAKFLKLIKGIDEANAKKKKKQVVVAAAAEAEKVEEIVVETKAPAKKKKKKAAKKTKKKATKAPKKKKVVATAAATVGEEVDDEALFSSSSPEEEKMWEDTLETMLNGSANGDSDNNDDDSDELFVPLDKEDGEKSTIKGLDATEEAFFMSTLSEIAEDELKDVDAKTQNLLMKDLGNVQKEIEEILGRENVGFNMDDDEEVVDARPKKKVKKKKKKTTKKAPKKAPAAAASDDKNPWGALKQSTLKRKTIAQLTEYLEDREVDVTGLSKNDLVATVQSL